MQVIQVKAKMKREMYYKEATMFGAYSFAVPVHSDQPVKIDVKWNNFVVSGITSKLKVGKEYTFTMKIRTSGKYKGGYEFVEFSQPKLDTAEAQQDYLREVVAKSYAEALIKAYPDSRILDLIMEDKIDLSKVKGLGEKYFEDRVKANVSESYGIAQAIVELRDLQVTGTQIKKLINHFGNQDILIEKVKSNIYSLTEVTGFGFSRIDEYALKRGDDPTSSKRIKACIDYILTSEGNNNGHVWLEMNHVMELAFELLKIETRLVSDVLTKAAEGKYKTLHVKGKCIALTKFVNYEKSIAKHLTRINDKYNTSRMIDYGKIETKVGIVYTEEQRNAIKLVSDKGVILLNGRAGTGKSATLIGMKESLVKEYYMACALSGQAVKVLSGRGIDAMTIHRMIAENADGKLDYDLVIIDEMSMVSIELFLQVLNLIPDGTQLILTGDIGQLPAIGIGSPFIDLINSGVYSHQELTVIHRQALKSGITKYANMVYDGKQINGYMDSGLSVLGELNDFKLLPFQDKTQILNTVLAICKNSYDKFGKDFIKDFIVLAVNKSRTELSVDNLNHHLRKIFNADNLSKYNEFKGFYKGDKVIHNGNNKDATNYDTYMDYELAPSKTKSTQVYNGSIGYIVEIDEKEGIIFIDFDDVDGIVAYKGEDIFKISLAYSITVHKSQGSAFKNVLLTFDYSAYKLLSKQLVYTGMTRAIETLVMIVENGALHKAIKTDLGHTRQTFLKELVKGEF